MLETLRLLLVLYLLLLAVSAAWGVHRQVLLLPARSLYALFQTALFLLSFGRVRLSRPRRHAARPSVRQALEDFQEIQLQEVRSASWRRGGDD